MSKLAPIAKSLSVVAGCMSAALFTSSALATERNASIPDFSGMWGRNAFDLEAPQAGPAPVVNIKRLPNGTGDPQALVGDYNNPILKPEAAQIVKQQGQVSLSGDAFPDPSNQCAPYPPPYTLAMQLGVQLLQAKNEVTLIYPQDDQIRRVRLNAAHPAHVTPSWKGDSVGHYEGDTLVVDTVGIKTGPLAMVDRYGTPHSEALHVVERYRLIDGEAAREAAARHEKLLGRLGGPPGAMLTDPNYGKGLQVQVTVEDPTVFTTPWSATVTYQRSRLEWTEQVCAENFREYYHGKDTTIPQAAKPDF